jgi:RNA polymerase sigma-70 factor, ECF subfamily
MPYSSRELLAAMPRLRRYARLLVEDPAYADDIVATTVARAAAGPALRSQHYALLELLRSVHAEALARDRSSPPPPIEPSGLAPEASSAERGEVRAQQVLGELRRLPLELREAVVLVAVERLSYEEVAMILQVPVATVLSRVQQAREALRASAIGGASAHTG